MRVKQPDDAQTLTRQVAEIREKKRSGAAASGTRKRSFKRRPKLFATLPDGTKGGHKDTSRARSINQGIERFGKGF